MSDLERPREDGLTFEGQDAYDVLSSAITDAVVVVEEDGGVAFAGPSLRHVLGLDPEDVEGRPVLDLVHPEDAERSDVAAFWRSGLPFECGFRMRNA